MILFLITVSVLCHFNTFWRVYTFEVLLSNCFIKLSVIWRTASEIHCDSWYQSLLVWWRVSSSASFDETITGTGSQVTHYWHWLSCSDLGLLHWTSTQFPRNNERWFWRWYSRLGSCGRKESTHHHHNRIPRYVFKVRETETGWLTRWTTDPVIRCWTPGRDRMKDCSFEIFRINTCADQCELILLYIIYYYIFKLKKCIAYREDKEDSLVPVSHLCAQHAPRSLAHIKDPMSTFQ